MEPQFLSSEDLIWDSGALPSENLNLGSFLGQCKQEPKFLEEEGPFCQTCLKKNKKTRLKFRYLDLEKGIYLCDDPSCFTLDLLMEPGLLVQSKNVVLRPKVVSSELAEFVDSLPESCFHPDLGALEDEEIDKLSQSLSDFNFRKWGKALENTQTASSPSSIKQLTQSVLLSSPEDSDDANPIFLPHLLDSVGFKYDSDKAAEGSIHELGIEGLVAEDAPTVVTSPDNRECQDVVEVIDIVSDPEEDSEPKQPKPPPAPRRPSASSRRQAAKNLHFPFSQIKQFELFPIWINQRNSCWLDATLCLLVFNGSLHRIVQSAAEETCLLRCVMEGYLRAMNTGSFSRSRRLLDDTRDLALKYLKSRGFLDGQFESLLTCLDQLLRESKPLKATGRFHINYRWEMKCYGCKSYSRRTHTVMVPTIMETELDFSFPHNVYSIVQCSRCKAKCKNIFLFDDLPETFFLHYMNGFPETSVVKLVKKLSFRWCGYHYNVTGMVIYRQKCKHFIAYVKHPQGWVCCDDLKSFPMWVTLDDMDDVHAPDIHILVWEKVPKFLTL